MRARGDAGFTLLDVLLAMLMFTLAAVGLLSMQLSSLSANVRARELQEATQLCQDKVEQLRLMPLPLPAPPANGESLDGRGCLVTGDSRPACGVLAPGQRYTRTWTIDTTIPGRFEVRTSWSDAEGRGHTVAVDDVR